MCWTNLFSCGSSDMPSCDACLASVWSHHRSCFLALSFDAWVMARLRCHHRLAYAQAKEPCLGSEVSWRITMKQTHSSFAGVTRATRNRVGVITRLARGLGVARRRGLEMHLYNKTRSRHTRTSDLVTPHKLHGPTCIRFHQPRCGPTECEG